MKARALAFASVAVLAALGAAALARPEYLHLSNLRGAHAPPCGIGTPDHPADWRRCQARVVKGAAKPEPYPVRPDLVGPGKP